MREPLAIVGIGCRLPGGADSPASFWRLLLEGVDAVTRVPPERWNAERHRRATASDQGGFLTGVDLFDPLFFGISPREASRMDPQQRLLLEVAFEALEDGGLPLERVWGSRTGVFVGLSNRDYSDLQSLRTVGPHSSTGEAFSIAANRISWCFHLTGPSLAVDTACSSGLTALHLACQSLWSGESTAALVGAANLVLHPRMTACFSSLSMLSPDGRCRAFDASGQGFVRGEGAGMVLLKPLAAALADNDRIYALLLGTAVNQDGHTPGLTVPSQAAQEALLREAYSQAGVMAAQVGYVEAHGTGTPVGDPIEARAIARVLGVPGRQLPLGSVKTNLGHLEPAAGIAGLIKAALVLHHRTIPPSLHFHQAHPEIPFEGLRVPRAPEPLTGPVVGVNSFGFGGANAHAVLGRAPQPEGAEGPPPRPPFAMLLSAHSPEALRARARSYLERLEEEPCDPGDLAYTLAVRRSHLSHRLAVLGDDLEALAAELRAWLAGEAGPAVFSGRAEPHKPCRVAFVFTGQGAQWWAMGRQLLEDEPLVRRTVERVDRVVGELGGWSVLEELQRPQATSRMHLTEISQPALFALQMGLVELLRQWGVEPQAVIGHSVGEAAAACTAGVLSLEEGARLVFHRGRLMGQTRPGKMLAVGLSEEAVAPYLEGLSLAAVNGPDLVTVAGEAGPVQDLARTLEEKGIFCRLLPLDYAFHSPLMDPIEAELRHCLADVRPRPAALPLVSTVTGDWSQGEDWDADYHWRNVRQPVRFAAGLDRLLEAGFRVFLEVGPHPALCRSMADAMERRGLAGAALATLRRGGDDHRSLRAALAGLHVRGVPVRWSRLYPAGRLVELPLYPWQRERCWVEDEDRRRSRLEPQLHPLLGRRRDGPGSGYENEVGRRSHPWLEHHRLGEHPLIPATAYLEMALAAAGPAPVLEAEDVEFARACFVPADDPVELRVEHGEGRFAIYSRSAEGWVLHASGRVRAGVPARRLPRQDLAELQSRLKETLDAPALYARFSSMGLDYGPAFQGLRWARVGQGEALGRVELPVDPEEYCVHPALLDAALQTALLLLPADGCTRLPVGVARYRLHRRPGPRVYAHARGDGVTLLDEEGEVLAELQGLSFRPLEDAGGPERLLYRFEWMEQPLEQPGRPLRLRLDPQAPAALVQALGEAGHTVVSSPEATADGVLHTALEAGPDTPLRLLQALQQGGPGRVWVATRSAQAVCPQDEVEPWATAVWGLVRAAASEHPEARYTLVDLGGPADYAALAREMAAASQESEVALRGGRRLVHRFRRVGWEALTPVRPAPGPVRLTCPRPGVLENLALVDAHLEPPGPGEILVEVRAAGLNFSDVLKAMGLYPGTPGGALQMGLEMAGVVAATGPGVEGLRPGDRVMGLGRRGGTLASQVLTSARLVVPIPEGLGFEEAASLPVAYLTAWYALRHLGRLAPGETVLIHAASGGVGLAAVALARQVGARVLATAGSPEKRRFLRERGVEEVYDSRSLEFVEGVREATGGRGVDMVLNSLTGQAIPAGLSLLAPGGRFLELGKRDIYADARLGLRPFRNNLSYFAIDLEQVIGLRPDLVAACLEEVTRGLAQGSLAPLPWRSLPLTEAAEALRTMAGARHIGKLVLSVPSGPLPASPDPQRPPVRALGTYLIVGGLGGFGRAAAAWLVRQGARRLVLCGRRGAATPGAEEAVAELRAAGAEVTVVAADVADPEQARALVAGCPDLRGVLHAAMVLDDAPLEDIDARRLQRVLAPKALGAWNLHQACGQRPLDFFVTFSSISAVFGNPGQAAYCAANAFLDGLAWHRRRQGLVATSVQWGALGDVGWLRSHERVRRHLESSGVVPLQAAEALAALGTLLALQPAEVAVARVDWNRLARSLGGLRPPFEELAAPGEAGGGSAEGLEGMLERLRRRLAAVVGVPPERLDPARPLTDLGLDSLMVFEIRNWLAETVGVSLAPAELLRGPTLEELAAILVARAQGQGATPEPEPSTPTAEAGGQRSGFAPVEAADRSPRPVPAEARGKGPAGGPPPSNGQRPLTEAEPLEDLADFVHFQERRRAAREAGLENPYFQVFDGVAGATTVRQGQTLLNFSSYNYLGLSGHPEVSAAAIEAIGRYGTSVSASRLVAGERPLHRQLEQELARFLGTEEAMVLVSGHATNVSVVAHLVGPGDLILHDSLIHNSALQGALASRATRRAFPHNDLVALDRLLTEMRGSYRRTLVLVEGLYSMDGDYPDLPALLELKARHRFLLMVDEAHSLGVLGPTGRGLAEQFGLERSGDVIWMGTLSKALASCGGYLAGKGALIDYLKHTLPGFVYSVGMPPASAAAALGALRVLQREPERVARLRQRSARLFERVRAGGFEVGPCRGVAIIPVIVGEAHRTIACARAMQEGGVNVSPVLDPAVPADACRLRFFVTCEHTDEQLDRAVQVLASAMAAVPPSLRF